MSMGKKERILTGMRPTGPLHLGHYVGALENWLNLQKKYDCYFLIADYQAFGDYADNISKIRDSVIQVAMDWLAVGLDPEKTTFAIQSYVPEHAELAMLLSMIIPKSFIDRNPTLKSEMAQQKEVSLGFFNYPASQVADILLIKANLVPVGEDQSPVIEQTREIAKDFNKTFGKTFVIPEAKIGRVARLCGTDGKPKMSKSGGNSILLSDDEKTLKEKVMSIYTDPKRIHATDPGKVAGNPVFIYHDAFNPNKDEVADLKSRYKKGAVGDIEVKQKLFMALNNFLEPIREKRKYFESRPKETKEILVEGTKKARKTAQETIEIFRENSKFLGLLR